MEPALVRHRAVRVSANDLLLGHIRNTCFCRDSLETKKASLF